MQALLYCDLVKGTLSETPGGPAFVWPKLTQGDDLTLALRLTQKVGTDTVEVSRVCRQLRASIGRVDARPESGTFRLKIGDESTSDLAFNTTAQEIQGALNTLPGMAAFGEASVTLKDGSWLIQFGTGQNEVPLTLGDNALQPLSFGRIRASQFDGAWVHELRLIQAPVASTADHARVVPPGPSLVRLQSGGSNGSMEWNEVQKLTVPMQFRGTYQIRRGFARSALLSVEDGAEEIQDALAPLADDGGEFLVTNPTTSTAHIEFRETMGGMFQPLLEVQVFDAPEGDLTFTLRLESAELSALMRPALKGEEKLQFEVEAILEDPQDADALHTVTLVRQEVTVQSELQWEELTAQASIDWLRPPLPRDYVPFTRDQIITGSQHYVTTLGDAEHTAFTVDHNLNTEAIHITLRRNESDGALLVPGTDYTASIDSADSVNILVAGDPPTPGSLAIVITSAGPVSAFQAHTHTMAQIEGLQLLLETLGADIEMLKDVIPTGALMAEAKSEGPIASWTLPKVYEIYPLRAVLDAPSDKDGLASIDVTKLPRAKGLLAAVHDAEAEPLPATLPAISTLLIGRVFVNAGTSPVLLPGGMGHRSVTLKPGQHATCDGRLWYRVERFGNETSFYPSDFTRELFLFSVNDRQLRIKKRLEIRCGIELAILKCNSRAQWSFVVEWGGFTRDDVPATTGANLANIAWHPVPLLEQRLIVTPVPCVHAFGINITRMLGTENGAPASFITASQILYGASSTAGSAPDSANFAVRGRLIRFDTENSQPDPRGFAALLGLDRSITTEGSDSDAAKDIGTAVIRSV